MDLGLYARVMWRFKYLVATGAVVAAVLAFFSFATISTSGKLGYRDAQKYVSYARLAVSEPGFPEGSLSIAGAKADTARLSGLAVYYSNYADTDAVRALMTRQGPIHGELQVAPVSAVPGNPDQALPLISIAAIATSPKAAEELATRQASALRQYVIEEQNQNRIDVNNRVVLRLVKSPASATVFQARSTTLPVVVFLTVLMATMGFAFVLENLRPRIREASGRLQSREAA